MINSKRKSIIKYILRWEKSVHEGKSHLLVFKKIYETNFWGGRESVSGTGSSLYQTRALRKALLGIFENLQIETILDIPCGDFHWMKEVISDPIQYIGADVVDALIKQNNATYSSDHLSFEHMDLLTTPLPKVDLIFCRDCFVHFSFQDIHAAISQILQSGSKYILTTSFPEEKFNFDIHTGDWRPINLELAPFYFPKPVLIIDEECEESGGRYQDKSMFLWEVSSLDFIQNRRFNASKLNSVIHALFGKIR